MGKSALDVIDNIRRFNRGREPERLAMKYAGMRRDAFVFLRATCHLFYDRLPQTAALESPAAWCCGDLHLENFGSYKGMNRLAYFDINDFDEAALAPLSWDLVRLLTSVLIGAKGMGLGRKEAKTLCTAFVEAYGAALVCGKSAWVERDTASGLVRTLLDNVTQRTRADFLDLRTVIKGRRRRIRIDGKKALAASSAERERVLGIMHDFAQKQTNPEFYQPLDIARRIAGNGSLGVERYIVLVRGKGGTDGNHLLDMKQALPSSLAPHLTLPQPKWKTQAHRTIALQYRMQAVSMAFLHALGDKRRSFILRALLPSEDRVTLDRTVSSMSALTTVMQTMGGIVASAHLRSAGRQGSANADELIAFGLQTTWRTALIRVAQDCADQVHRDWLDYCAAYDDGAFK